jgi:hypothetical protein
MAGKARGVKRPIAATRLRGSLVTRRARTKTKVIGAFSDFHRTKSLENAWSGRRESNPHLQFGKLARKFQ